MNPIKRRILIIVASVVAGFLILQLASVLMAMSIYSWFFQTIRGASGMPDALNGAISIWLVAITLMLLPTFFSAIFFRKSVKKVLIIAGALSGWILIVYFLSLPKEGQFFNPMTGQTMYRYARSPDGKIDLFPLGYKFHPRYGTELKLVTPEIIKEIDKKATEAVTSQAKEIERQKLMNLNLQIAQKERELAQQRAEASERKEKEALNKLQLSQRQREQELAQQLAEANERREKEAQVQLQLAQKEKELADKKAQALRLEEEATKKVAQEKKAALSRRQESFSIRELPYRYTPFEVEINGVVHIGLYDGEDVYALPPGWSREDAIYVSATGYNEFCFQGVLPEGIWRFWSVDNPRKAVLVHLYR